MAAQKSPNHQLSIFQLVGYRVVGSEVVRVEGGSHLTRKLPFGRYDPKILITAGLLIFFLISPAQGAVTTELDPENETVG